MSKEIELIPKLRKEIIDAVNNRKLVLFLGAGVSALTGLPLWNELANNLAKKCISENCITYSDAEIVFSKITDTKQKISVVYELFAQHNKTDIFYQCLENDLSCGSVSNDAEIIFDFCEWSNATVLTTNADKLLDKHYQDNLIHSELSELVFRKNYAALYKIHGCISKKDTLVFTSEQYLKRYNNDKFKDFLSRIFESNYTVLFIGYGISEFELLEFMIKPSEIVGNDSKLFFLSPYFSYEKPLMNSMDLYYKSLGIELIPYSRDKNNYNQLPIIINEWKKEIETKTNISGMRINQINAFLVDINNFSQIYQIIQNNDYAKRHFLTKLRSVNNLDSWLKIMLNTELFDYEKRIPECFENGINWPELYLLGYCIDNYNDSNILLEIKNKIIDIVKFVLDNPKYLSLFGFSHDVLDLVTKFDSSILDDASWSKLINSIYEEDNRDLQTIVYCCHDNIKHIEKWDNKKINTLCELIVDKFDLQDSNKIYFIDFFYRHIFVKIINKVSFNIFDMLVEWLSRTEELNAIRFAQVGAFAERYGQQIRYQNNLIFIAIDMIKDLINADKVNFDEFLSKQLISTSFTSKSKIVKKLCIYVLAVKFDLFKERFFKLSFNPFLDWNLYGDLYYLIERNNKNLDYSECCQLYNWIIESDYGGKSEEYQKTIKFDFIDLLSKEHPEFDAKKELYISDIHDDAPEIYDRNKQFIIGRCLGYDNKDILEEMSNLSFEEIIDYLSNLENKRWHSEYDYQKALQIVLESNYDMLNENVSKIKDLPKWCYSTVVDCLEKYIRDNEPDMVFILLDELYKCVATTDDFGYLFCNILRIINSAYLKNNDKVETTVLDGIEKFVKKIVESTKNHYDMQYDFDEYENNGYDNYLANNWISMAILLLLKVSCARKNLNIIDDSLDYIIKLVNELHNNAKRYINYSILNYIGYIYYIDKHKADTIINSNINDFDSATVFMYSNERTLVAYKRLKEIGYFDYLFSDESDNTDETIKIITAEWSVQTYIEDGFETFDIIEKMFNCQNSNIEYYVFSTLSEYVDKDISKPRARKMLKQVCIYTNNALQNNKIESSDQIMRFLAKAVLLLKSKDKVFWECLVNLSMKFDCYLSEELYELLKKCYNSRKSYVISIIKNIVLYSKWNVFGYEKDYDDLIFMIKNDLESKECFYEINNSLLKKNITRFTE